MVEDGEEEDDEDYNRNKAEEEENKDKEKTRRTPRGTIWTNGRTGGGGCR